MEHVPVFLQEILTIFNPQPGEIYVDATVNGGGHARALAERVGDTGRVIGIDLDEKLIKMLRTRNEQEGRKNIELVHGNYADLDEILTKLGYQKVDGILFDLGFSSYHVDESGRGFSFLRDEPLDMRYDPERNELTAEKIIHTWSSEAIADILYTLGGERYSKRIAARIVAERAKKRISTSDELAQIIYSSIPRQARTSHGIHPATRAFQALRISVNDELANIEQGICAGAKKLQSGGKLIAISFHSLEDRSIKLIFKKLNKEQMLALLTLKPIRPSMQEVISNPQARSAKLRAAQKIA